MCTAVILGQVSIWLATRSVNSSSSSSSSSSCRPPPPPLLLPFVFLFWRYSLFQNSFFQILEFSQKNVFFYGVRFSAPRLTPNLFVWVIITFDVRASIHAPASTALGIIWPPPYVRVGIPSESSVHVVGNISSLQALTAFCLLFRVWVGSVPVLLGPCHHGMARPQVADRGTASDKEGSCE